MFGFFKKVSEKDRLYKKYEELMAESHSLSKTNRILSDQKYLKAQEYLNKWSALQESEL